MNKTVLGGLMVAAACVSTVAQAADFDRRYSQPYTVTQPLANSWIGPYIGGNFGYSWGDVSHFPASPSGVMGGGQIGYNWQAGALVLGVEGDIQLTGADDTFAAWKFSNPWFGTVRGRVGYAFNNILLYGTGGLAFGEVKSNAFGLSESQTTAGWTVGAGAEFALTQNWSAKVEYLYVDLSSQHFLLTGASNGYQFNTIRVGVNYRF